jgi:DivIVA domain-containing protein
MATGDLHRRAAASGPKLTPEEIASRGFASAFRGVSETEVRNFLRRVADEVAALRNVEEDLSVRLREAEEQLRHPPAPTEQQLLDSLGEETARVLRSAQEAAEDIRSRAEERAAQLVKDAQEEARRTREAADEHAARRTQELDERAEEQERTAEQHATELREAAERDASEVREAAERDGTAERERAHREAEAELETARAGGRQLLDEARAVRERVLADLARRRALLQAQVDELRAGRDRLLDAYRVVKRTLSDATEALGQVEARAAVELASPPPSMALPPVEGEVELQLDVISAPAEIESPPPSVEEPEPAPDQPQPEPEPAPAAEVPPEPAEPAAAAEAAEAPPAPPAKGKLASKFRDALGLERDVVWEGAADESAPQPAADTTAGIEADWVEVTAAVSAPETAGDAAAEPAEEDTAKVAADVDELFARLRAGTEEPAGDESTPEPAAAEAGPEGERSEPEAASREPEAGSEPEPELDLAPGGDDARRLQRADALAPLHRALVRKAKRALQDDQNALLDAIRKVKKGKPTSETVLVPIEAHTSTWADVLRTDVTAAFAGGYESIAGDDANATDLPDGLLDELALTVIDPLRDRLADAVDSAADEEAMTQRIGARFREVKGQRLDQAADDILAVAWARGTYEAAPVGVSLRWLPEETGRCPDCDDDALEVTVKGEEFPTGQLHPPAHPGCHCFLVPAGGGDVTVADSDRHEVSA